MGSSGSGAVDCSVGSIVWVRRRNGSWWPGKILGPDELSASHLTSPRSGTPVKLLGREDASVDWYNLEKSKRVKAFRCGEFDDCIERAESSQGMPIKKREKYARREDAILHALELEKQLLRKQGKLGAASDRTRSKSFGAVKTEVVNFSGGCEINNGKLGNSKSNQFSKRLDAYHKDEITSSPLHSQKVKEENQPSWEDDNSEAIPRMRGLQDFGLRTAPSKRKLSASGASDGSRKPTVDSNSQAPSSGGPSMGKTSNVNGKNSLDKRKRLHEGLTEEYLVEKRDKSRPLVQVLQSSAKLEVPHLLQPDCGTVSTSISGEEQMGGNCRAKRSRCLYLPAGSSDTLDYKGISPSLIEMSTSQFGDGDSHPHPGSLIEENDSGFMEDLESGSSETDTSELESDSSETEPDMDEEMTTLSGAAVPAEAEPDSIGGPEALEHESMRSDEPDESAFSGDISHLYPHDLISANEAVSKWQLKGKRNSRSFIKRSVDATDGRVSNGSIHGSYYEEKRTAFSHGALGQNLRFHRNDDFSDGVNDADLNGKDFGTQVDTGRYSYTSRALSKGRFGRNMIDWEDWTWEDRPALKGRWEDKLDRFDPMFLGRHHFGGRTRSMLVDVDLKVQASYQKEPVPIVSLMSKLNGKAIIGHPIQIEVLENGSSETLLSTNDYFGNEAIDHNGNTALPPAWRTARRTNLRVPRPHLSSSMDGDEAAEGHSFFDQERKPPLKKLNVESFGHKASLVRKSFPHISRPSTDRKLPRKQPKKVSLSSSQKTRTLSSIAVEQNLITKPVYDSNSCQMDGLIKPESSGPTTVACIPVKLVFSRLLEKINRPPSKAASKLVLSNSDAVRDPL